MLSNVLHWSHVYCTYVVVQYVSQRTIVGTLYDYRMGETYHTTRTVVRDIPVIIHIIL